MTISANGKNNDNLIWSQQTPTLGAARSAQPDVLEFLLLYSGFYFKCWQLLEKFGEEEKTKLKKQSVQLTKIVPTNLFSHNFSMFCPSLK